MSATDLRRKLAWLIGIRFVISTVLLGGAIFAQITSPGSFPVDPFFFLIAFLGVVVGGIVIAMYLPIFDLISKLA